MTVFVLCAVLIMLRHTMRDLNAKSRIAVAAVLTLYLLGLIYYAHIINGAGWQYAIPGADMLAHFEGAKGLSQGKKWSDLAAYGVRFEGIGLNTIGYFVYAQILSWLLFALPIVSEGVGVYLVYVIQIILMVDALLRYNRCYCKIFRAREGIGAFLTLAFCVTYAVTAYQLLRDTLMMWIMAVMFDYIFQDYSVDETVISNRKGRPVRYAVNLVLLGLISVVFRFYSAMIFVPVALYYGGHRKLGLISSLSLTAVLLFGLNLIDQIKQLMLVSWSFDTVDVGETIRFLLFPNIVSQSRYLMDWSTYFSGYNYLSGCNVPGVYYAMSVWNMAMYPLAGVSLAASGKDQRIENALWLSILLNVAMLYSISYVNIDTRHKLFMSLPICLLAHRGYQMLRRKSLLLCGLYVGAVCGIVLIAFLIA